MNYAICYTSRTGSSLLCDWLRMNSVGCPDEWALSTPTKEKLLENRQRYTVDDICGVKIGVHDYLQWKDLLELDRFIWLQRRDVLSQAISLYRAIKTGQWFIYSYQKMDRSVCFDREAILELKLKIEDRNMQWRKILKDKPHIDIWYEEMIKDPELTIRQIGSFLQVDLPDVLETKVARKIARDDITEDWLRRLH